MRRTVGTLAAVACGALVALAACGSPAGTAGSGSGPTIGVAAPTPVGQVPPAVSDIPTSPAPSSPPGTAQGGIPGAGKATDVPKAQVDTSHVRTPPVGVQAAGRKVMFSVGQAGCQDVSGQVTAQTATAVTVNVVTTTTNHAGEVCPMIVREVPVTVTLAAPLGSRTLVFGQVTRHG
ncbi:MAG TPA: hypothetical protein VHV49_19730 [Pseudonocardiaceae bacterium]|jgi:hypothetical protein|nr:hypothetical protein [Pseudonocardiaceae bacterium]